MPAFLPDCVLAARACGHQGPLSIFKPDNQSSSSLSGQHTSYTLRDLLLFSAVCGVGLDTVPIAGNTPAAQIAAIYQETAALAFRLNKPLSVRLLPMGGLLPGQRTKVNNPYLTDTAVFSTVG